MHVMHIESNEDEGLPSCPRGEWCNLQQPYQAGSYVIEAHSSAGVHLLCCDTESRKKLVMPTSQFTKNVIDSLSQEELAVSEIYNGMRDSLDSIADFVVFDNPYGWMFYANNPDKLHLMFQKLISPSIIENYLQSCELSDNQRTILLQLIAMSFIKRLASLLQLTHAN